ncbi:MAG TPA: PqqD family protein [Gemmatimonadaceae bacterium]|nr:PqqD family protein [Gemmatimonadaceae bacterium]
MDSHTNAAPQRPPRLRLNPAVTSQIIDDNAVLIDLRTNEIYEMNHTSARLWQLLGEGLEVDDIERRLEAEFEIEAEELHRQIDTFLATLLDAKLVEHE